MTRINLHEYQLCLWNLKDLFLDYLVSLHARLNDIDLLYVLLSGCKEYLLVVTFDHESLDHFPRLSEHVEAVIGDSLADYLVFILHDDVSLFKVTGLVTDQPSLFDLVWSE